MRRDRKFTYRVRGDELAELSRSLAFVFGVDEELRAPVVSELEGPVLRGRIEIHSPRPGLHLLLLDLRASRDLALQVTMRRPMVAASVVVSGLSRQRLRRAGSGAGVIEYAPSRNVIGSYGRERSVFELSRGTHRLVDLKLSPELARGLVELAGIGEGTPLRSIMGSSGAAGESLGIGLPGRLQDIAAQVLECPLEGPSRRLYMEAKALELLSLELDTFSPVRAPDRWRDRRELERLELARRVLEEEFCDPPSVVGLARRVGLNELKLKRGFREVYRTTVYGHVRRLRLERARALLLAGEHNVTEAALATGHSCFGHFSAAFKRRFGILPGRLRRARPGRGNPR
jgi:AraC-like DNA-binding protein